MNLNIGNLLASMGNQNAGFQATQQQQREVQAKAVAAQRLQQLLANTQGQPMSFPNTPSPLATGMTPPGMSAPGSPVNLFSGGAAPAGQPGFNTEANPTGGAPTGGGAPAYTPPMGGMPSTPAGTGDPLGYENVMRGILSGGGDPATNFMAWQDTEKTLRPYGQIQGRSQLETQREQGRETIQGMRDDTMRATTGARVAAAERGQDIRAETDQARLHAYTTRWSQDRDEKSREADQKSQDVNRSINERIVSKTEALKFKREALDEKAKEAERQSADKRLAIEQRQQAAEDAQEYRQQVLELRSQEAEVRAQQGQEKIDLSKAGLEEKGRHNVATEGSTSRRLDEQGRHNVASEKLGQEKIDLGTASLAQKNAVIMRGQDKNYQARMAAVASRATPAQQAAFRAAQSEFSQASANYRNEKISVGSTTESLDSFANKAVAAQQNMENLASQMGRGGASEGATGKVKIIPGEEVIDYQGQKYVNRNGQAVPAEQ